MNIYEKLNEASFKLNNMNLKKSGYNSHRKFSYFNLDDFIPQVIRTFRELKLHSNFILKDKEAMLIVTNAENPEEQVITSSFACAESKTECQDIGAMHTYMRRYLFYALLNISEHDAIDAEIGKPVSPRDDDYKATIDNVKDIKQLNKIYEFYVGNARDDAWKKRLMDKSAMLNAVFNKEARVFESVQA